MNNWNIFESAHIPYIIIAIAFLIFAYILGTILKSADRKKKQRQNESRMTEKLNKMNFDVQNSISAFNRYVRETVDKAVAYEDMVTPKRISELIEDVQNNLNATNDYDTIMHILFEGKKKAEKIRSDMEAHEKDLESYRKEVEEKRAEQREKYPYYDTKYFKSCTNISEVKTLFRQLAKVYHPDAGGDADTYMELQSEYQSIVKRK